MGLFNDVGRFFETRLDEFLKSHPHLELQAIAEQLEEQEREAVRLTKNLTSQLEQIEQNLTKVAKEIQHWHQRVQQAEAGGRKDLAAAAKQREAALLRQGNQLWGKMQGTKQRIKESKTLLLQVQKKRQEVKVKMNELKNTQKVHDDYTASWESFSSKGGDRPKTDTSDPLEAQFQKWEMEEEIRQMKRQQNKT